MTFRYIAIHTEILHLPNVHVHSSDVGIAFKTISAVLGFWRLKPLTKKVVFLHLSQ